MLEFKKHGNHSFAILFLRVLTGFDVGYVADTLKKIWEVYEQLKKGVLVDTPKCRIPSSGLTVLIGYGPKIFNLPGVRKKIPRDFFGKQFLPAIAGEPILEGCGIKYSKHSCENVGSSEHIAIQFISETQMATHRAVVETWQHLYGNYKNQSCLRLTKLYTGFQRDDGRSWLGFHDEVSNMKDAIEREGTISINIKSNRLKPDDFWTESGTYMAFLRTVIDLDAWNKIGLKDQELIVGRDKRSGGPIIGVDRGGKPILVENNPSSSSAEFYDPKFHDHPDYFKTPPISDTTEVKETASSRAILSQSHIGRTRHISMISSKDPTSRRIYRQGFDFVASLSDEKKGFGVGLNFISFQNDPKRLFFILTDPRWMGKTNFGGSPDLLQHDILSVMSAGMFFVPAREKPFPGASIFR